MAFYRENPDVVDFCLWSLSSVQVCVCVCVCAGDVSVGIKCDANMVGDSEADVDFDIIPNANDTFTVKYIPPAAGRLTVKVLFTDKVNTRTRQPPPSTNRWRCLLCMFRTPPCDVMNLNPSPHRKFLRARLM